MAGNKAVAYMGPGKVEIRTIDYPTFELSDGPVSTRERRPQDAARRDPEERRDEHLRQRPAHGPRPHHRPAGARARARDHREVVEVGSDVEFIKVGDLCSVPFNISCGACRNCKEGRTGICLNVNPTGPVPRTATSTWAVGSAARPST
jgi:glutathione-independent formaldehyde dehydrogenase